MPVNLSVKNVSDALAAALRRRARRNHRSLQGELVAILNDAVASADASANARRGRTSNVARETPAAISWTPIGADTIAPRSESALMIRNVREGRTKTLAELFEELSALGSGTPSESAAIIRTSRSSR